MRHRMPDPLTHTPAVVDLEAVRELLLAASAEQDPARRVAVLEDVAVALDRALAATR